MAENAMVVGTAEGHKKEDKHIEVPSSTPSAGTFNLRAFVQEKATTPVVKVTVFLDADGGKLLYTAEQRKQEIENRLNDLRGMSKEKLAVGEVSPRMAEIEQLEADFLVCLENIAVLQQRVASSALLVQLQVTNSHLAEKVREEVKESLLGSGSEEGVNPDEFEEHFMTSFIGRSCVSITNSAGAVIPGPVPFEEMSALRAGLIVTENAKLVQGAYEALNLNSEWLANVDAGFPR